MSRVMDTARKEAAQAEAEAAEPDEGAQPDAEPDEGAQPDAEPDAEELDEHEHEREGEQEAPEGLSMEAQREGLEREATRHHKALAKLMPGFEEAFSECPACMTFGYVPNPPLLVDETRERCPACNGRGGTLTGSLVEGHEAEQCARCMGNGWVTKTAPLPPVPAAPSYGPPAPSNGPGGEDPRVAELRAMGYVVTPTTPPVAPS